MGLRGPGVVGSTDSRGGMRVRMRMSQQVKRFFDNIGVAAEDALDNALTDVAMKIQTRTIENLAEGWKGPKGEGTEQDPAGAYDTGRLANSIQMSDNYLEKRVGSNVKYAKHMEFGTGPAIGRKRYLPPYGKGSDLAGWSRRQQIGDAGSVALQILGRGTFPRRYLGGAVYSEKHNILHEFAEHLENEINELTDSGVTVKVKRR